ncbi:histidine phosphatase family protein [Hoyosella altamirensis]|uniref:Uncharacterized protein n=1 Tax=Hoyosella altamirensis TaxID=616997 RepID=A0A839RVX3_9ACTN|nr:histidine phosphatase family protein [Hoyosella altamirensis]MBB3040174.1 hypothetical protein [Hoyosella altamirensis]
MLAANNHNDPYDDSNVLPFSLGQPHRYQPDDMLPDVAAAGRIRFTDLAAADRAWVVAVLTQRGVTADDLATRLRCSKRSIQLVRADPLCTIMTEWLTAQTLADTLAHQVSVTTRDAALAQDAHDKTIAALKAKLSNVLDQLKVTHQRWQSERHRAEVMAKYLPHRKPHRPQAPANTDPLF